MLLSCENCCSIHLTRWKGRAWCASDWGHSQTRLKSCTNSCIGCSGPCQNKVYKCNIWFQTVDHGQPMENLLTFQPERLEGRRDSCPLSGVAATPHLLFTSCSCCSLHPQRPWKRGKKQPTNFQLVSASGKPFPLSLPPFTPRVIFSNNLSYGLTKAWPVPLFSP